MSDDQKKNLEQQLWNIANTLRGKMGADEFRDYILGFIFYKYLSERMLLYANQILKEDGLDYMRIAEDTDEGQEYLAAIREESISKLGYFLKPSELFRELVRRGNLPTVSDKSGPKSPARQYTLLEDFDEPEEDVPEDDKELVPSNFILGDLAKILSNIEQSTMGHESEEDFGNLFEDLDLTSTKLGRTEAAKNAVIAKVLAHLDRIDFQLEDAGSDVLGDAYEYLIGKFASGAGKKAGEFYTPQEVSKVLAKLVTVGKKRLKSVYDPTCGSGSLLLRVAREVDDVGKFYGQELNRTTYNLTRMNMILHDVHYSRFDIKQDDTLEHPQHPDLRAEAIVANPPFSAQWSANPLHLSDDCFSQFGRLAPASKADFGFVQHMVYHLDDNGTMASVLPHGVLFRGAAEGHIRQYLVEQCNYLDAVIGLPGNIFYGTSIPTCILVLKKCREHDGDILFIDASQHFAKEKTQNYLREEDIDRIVDTYVARQTVEKYSYVAPLSEVRENDNNLNIPRYVDTFEAEADIDISHVAEELIALERQMKDTDQIIAGYCAELGIKTPF
ncbi:MAG: type I restriction-modification system subunit M [Bacteroidetes bacterium]|nr:type I restriction-modification system subunit M [Bacteroidota bacterium]